MQIINELKDLEQQFRLKMDDLCSLEDEEKKLEPKHIKMMARLYDSDLISRLPNQVLKDSAVENLILNDDRFTPIHLEYMTNKLLIKRNYREMRFIEEQMKNRRAEINYLTFGSDKNE